MVLHDYLFVFFFVYVCSTTLALDHKYDHNKVLDVKSGYVTCVNPSPDSIYPCYCSDDDDTLGRSLGCFFDFNSNEDVTEATHSIFSQFNETNNKFDYVQVILTSKANFVFDENTTGKLIMKEFNFDVYDSNIDGPKLFGVKAFENSKTSLDQISNLDSSAKWNFGPGTLDELNNVGTLLLNNYDFDSGLFPPSILFSLHDLILFGESTTFTNLPSVTMPKLAALGFRDIKIPGSTLPAHMLYNLPRLEEFDLIDTSNLEMVPDNFFLNSSCLNVNLYQNNIHTIDLGGLNPNTQVDLTYNQISQIQEKNFRPFVESVLNTPNAVGMIDLHRNQLDCFCDIKWLVVDLRDALNIFQNAECADGRYLADVDPELLEIECNDY